MIQSLDNRKKAEIIFFSSQSLQSFFFWKGLLISTNALKIENNHNNTDDKSGPLLSLRESSHPQGDQKKAEAARGPEATKAPEKMLH